jgi:CDP-glycerol glycerophosphotransferase (TagB/SpsB family)
LKVHIFHGLATDDTGKKGHYRVRGLYDLYCTRGFRETAFFSTAAKQHPHYEVVETGWSKMDPLFAGLPVASIRDSLATDKPVVLYAATFSPSLTSAPYLVETIRALSAEGQFHWIVTLHPKCPAHIQAQYRALQGPHLTFYESSQDVLPLMQAADVMLSDTSSIAIEYMLLDKPVVTFRNKVPAAYLLNVTEPDEIVPALQTALARPPKLLAAIRQFTAEVHPHRDGKSSERVLEAVSALLERGTGHLSKKPVNLLRKARLRKQLKYYRPW